MYSQSVNQSIKTHLYRAYVADESKVQIVGCGFGVMFGAVMIHPDSHSPHNVQSPHNRICKPHND